LKYGVCFDGKWQGKFDDLDDAIDYAREAAETDRLSHVVRFRWVRSPVLIMVVPEDRAEEGQRLWDFRTYASGAGGG
jgi:hypothetical protein